MCYEIGIISIEGSVCVWFEMIVGLELSFEELDYMDLEPSPYIWKWKDQGMHGIKL